MNLSCASFTIALIVASVAGRKHTLRDRQAAQLLVCQLAMECVSTPSADGQAETHHHIECSPVENERISDYSYPIDLPEDFVEANKVALVTGRLFATFPEGQIIDGKVIRPLNVPITVISPPESFECRHRTLSDTSGTKSVLVLRISANDASPTFSASQYYNYIFNNSQPDTAPSLSSQYSRLSFGQLNFVPTQYGVMEVPVNINAYGAASSNIRDAAITYVIAQYGVSSLTQLADHVIFCLPSGTGNWAGSSPVMSWRIVMNNDWCGYISGFMHEMGHNLGLLHSNQNNVQYMDSSSYMSAGYATPFYPLKSFNGANNAQFGWFSDRTIIVDPAHGGQMISLATFVDYGKVSKIDPVLIQVGTDVYLQYNRAKDFNIQTNEMIDQVTIVQQQNNGTSLLGAVDPSSNPQVILVNFDGTGRNVVIEACSTGVGDSFNPDWMAVSIGYDQSYCMQDTRQLPPPTANHLGTGGGGDTLPPLPVCN